MSFCYIFTKSGLNSKKTKLQVFSAKIQQSKIIKCFTNTRSLYFVKYKLCVHKSVTLISELQKLVLTFNLNKIYDIF